MVNDGDYLYLLGSFKAEKYESVGMMTFPTEWKKEIFQTTNQRWFVMENPTKMDDKWVYPPY